MIVKAKIAFLKRVLEQRLAQRNVELESWQAGGRLNQPVEPLRLQPWCNGVM
jgi:hypothetical protein